MEFINGVLANLQDFRVLFFNIMVQTNLLVFSGLILVGIRVSLGQVLVVGIPMAFYVYLERAVMLTYEYHFLVHIILGVLGFIMALRYILKLPLGTAFAATMVSCIILFSSEAFIYLALINYSNIDLESMLANPWLQISLGLLTSFPLLFIGLLAYFNRFSILKLSRGGKANYLKISEVGFKNNLR